MSVTAITTRTLHCDHRYIADIPCGEEFEGRAGMSSVKVRQEARRRGWTYVPGHPATGHNRDLCPAHKPDGVA